MRLVRNGLLVLTLVAAGPALAQETPPARVGRIAAVEGTIAFHMPGDTSWSAAGINYPVATGGSFWTDPQSRAQLRIGPDTIDMDRNTEVDITLLDEEVMQIAVPQGRIELRLHALPPGQSAEIDMARGSVRVLKPGVYDVAAGDDSEPSRVATFAGRARVLGGGLDVDVRPGAVAVLAGANPVTASYQEARPDEFSEWARAHEFRAPVAAARYVPPAMTGYADLDRYGRWERVPDYGEVWFPTDVSAGWAPYRDGNWVWVEPWGWTWVDSRPWGFAPFHYGRWARFRDRWCWVPGRYERHPVYAPALVAFVGGAQVGVGIGDAGGPAVGWFPLAPGEVYWPSYSRDPRYVRELNRPVVNNITTIVNRTVVNNRVVIEQNRQPQGAPAAQRFANRQFATVVPEHVFVNAQRVAPAALPVSDPVVKRFVDQAPAQTHPPVMRQAVAAPGPTSKPGTPAKAPVSVGRHPLASNAPPPPVRHPPALHAAPVVAHPGGPPKIERAAPTPAHVVAPPKAPGPPRIEPAAPAHIAPPPKAPAPPKIERAAPAHVVAPPKTPGPPKIERAAPAHVVAPPKAPAPPKIERAAPAHVAPPPKALGPPKIERAAPAHVAPPPKAPGPPRIERAAPAHIAPPPTVVRPATPPKIEHRPTVPAHVPPPAAVRPVGPPKPEHAPAAPKKPPPAVKRAPGEHTPPSLAHAAPRSDRRLRPSSHGAPSRVMPQVHSAAHVAPRQMIRPPHAAIHAAPSPAMHRPRPAAHVPPARVIRPPHPVARAAPRQATPPPHLVAHASSHTVQHAAPAHRAAVHGKKPNPEEK